MSGKMNNTSSIVSAMFRKATATPTAVPKFPFNAKTNPYKAKRDWPPDFSKLSQNYQFRLERRYRRRAKLKWARPTWTKIVKLGQWGSILFVCIYGALYMEIPDTGKTPFDGLREWYRGQQSTLFGSNATTSAIKNNATAPRTET